MVCLIPGHTAVLLVVTLSGALLLNFLISYCICASAFYLNEISYFFVITSLLVNILSGGMFPLEIFGDSIVEALRLHAVSVYHLFSGQCAQWQNGSGGDVSRIAHPDGVDTPVLMAIPS